MLGRSANSIATGLSTTSLVFGVAGFAQVSTALNTLHPAGMASCNILVNPAATSFLVKSGGTAFFPISLPNTTALAGATLHEQVLQVEVDAMLNMTAINSSNGLTLTAGAL